ncbi:MAG: hypothetical protein U5L46_01745 [Agrobacterium sp.]|nr:hypothetical protein [Agrobacterium sp.]
MTSSFRYFDQPGNVTDDAARPRRSTRHITVSMEGHRITLTTQVLLTLTRSPDGQYNPEIDSLRDYQAT